MVLPLAAVPAAGKALAATATGLGLSVGQLAAIGRSAVAAGSAVKAGYEGYKIGKKVIKTVGNFMPKRKAQRYYSSASNKKARTQRTYKQKGTKQGRAMPAVVADNQAAQVAKHKKVKDTLKLKKPYGIKVDSKFRKKVLKTLSDNKVKGYARLYKVGGHMLLSSGVGVGGRDSLEQWVFALPTGSIPNGAPGSPAMQWGRMRIGDCQSILEQLYAVSRLFNGQVAVANPSSVRYGLTDMFQDPTVNRSALKYEVTESKSIINIFNNSKMTIYFEMYVCRPKYQRHNSYEYAPWACTAIYDWADQLNADKVAEVSGNAYEAGVGINVSNIEVKTLGASPEQHSSWRKLWDYEKFSFVMEPGQKHQHVVQGETGVCDWSKFYKDGQFQNLQKWDRQVFFVAKPELSQINTNGTASGRFNQALAELSAGYGLLFECQSIYKFTMPEPTGFKNTATFASSLNQPLNFRRPAYLIDFITDFATARDNTAGLEKRVDDNDPDSNL